MNISDEAVEAAAKEWTRLMCGCYDPEDVPYLYDELRKVLRAAAPHMHDKAAETRLLAIAWAEAYQAGFQEGAGFGPTPNPYRSQA
jgi:hypothetical protein